MKSIDELFSELSRPDIDNKILLLTHTDLDGAGAAILTRYFFHNVTVKHCPNNSMSKDILEACTNRVSDGYDFILVCDISCSDEDALVVNNIPDIHKHLALIDHHPTAMGLNVYDWAVVYSDMVSDSFRSREYPDPSKGHSSATGLLFDYFSLFVPWRLYDATYWIKAFTGLVSIYDTWDWKTILNCKEAGDLSALCFLYGIEYFEDMICERLAAGKPEIFNETDRILLECEARKVHSYLERIRKSYRYGTIDLAGVTYDIVYCAASQYLPQIFEDMKTMYPDKDIYTINCGNTISMRAVKDTIDIGAIVKQLGGGGHKGAAGVPIPYEKQIAYFESAIGTKFNYKLNTTDFFSST